MENNNVEGLHSLLQLVKRELYFAETKNTIIAFITLWFSSNFYAMPYHSYLTMISLAVYCYILINCVSSFFPKTDNTIEKDKAISKEKSLVFFGDISHHNSGASYLDMYNSSLKEDKLAVMYADNIVINSKLINRKLAICKQNAVLLTLCFVAQIIYYVVVVAQSLMQ